MCVCSFFSTYIKCTENPLSTDTRYNDKIRYNDNLSVKKPSLVRQQLVTNYDNIVFNTIKNRMF